MGEVAFVALGANLGDRARALADARRAIGALPGTRVVAETAVEETAPFGPPGQPPYLNQMLALDTTLAPHALLDALHGIERAAGRLRDVRWGPRTLDLDIVTFGDRQMTDDRLTVPHPGLRDRDFWQREAAELETALRG
ncbi:MAG: 2-amino-4-hydroxy-6-hydroxymethyldihydropteridine diphosphokinase [Gemmatimonadota bacterium]|nr:2-amino-4-hydroxy-6-hydroxymethyldihydropteridine diphosphokinase [Gemmatimonadota bacterium]MDE3171841.1 2-amino-4-hydroxy-6-hydroxymethyldihydropteridine diphosphokinase [Gemmatimonadota bacterium]